VANSYDAGAQRVWIQLPPTPVGERQHHRHRRRRVDGLPGPRGTLAPGPIAQAVRGAGGGERVVRGRRPIGKFGIGKLATYVLARQLTYVCRQCDKHLAVTMDFGRVQGTMEEPQHLALEVISLSAEQAERTLRAVVKDNVALKALFDKARRPIGPPRS